MKTIDMGIRRSSRKPNPPPSPSAQTSQELKKVKPKKIAQIAPHPLPNPLTPRKKYLKLKAAESTPKNETKPTKSTTTYKNKPTETYKNSESIYNLQSTRIYNNKPTDLSNTKSTDIYRKKCISAVRKQEDQEESRFLNLESASPSPEPTSKTKILVKRFENMKSSNSDDITSKNLNFMGGKSSKPIGCNLTDQPRLDFLVMKKPEILHHSDWASRTNVGLSSEPGEGYHLED